MKRDVVNTLKGIMLGLAIVAAGASVFVYAWTGPTLAAPNGNVARPVNISSATQVKAGALGVGGANPVQSGYTATMLDVNGYVRFRSVGAASGKVLVSQDSYGTARWGSIAAQGSCNWVKPDLTCGVGGQYRGARCGVGEYAAGVSIAYQQCPQNPDGTSNNITYTYVYCCSIVSY